MFVCAGLLTLTAWKTLVALIDYRDDRRSRLFRSRWWPRILDPVVRIGSAALFVAIGLTLIIGAFS